MKKWIRIDENGFFVEDVLFDDGVIVDEDIVTTPVPEGSHRPRWNGTGWVEGLTQQELDAIKNRPKPKKQIDVFGEQIVLLELRMLQLERGSGA